MSQRLYEHQPAEHQPRNVNEQHQAERLGLNDRIAVWVSTHVGSMSCAYAFACIGIASLVGVLTGNTMLAVLCGSFSSYFLQLVLLPILALGQNILGRHAQLQAEEQHRTTLQTYRDLAQLVQHLRAQDDVLVYLRQTQALILDKLGIDIAPTTEGRLPVVRMGARTMVDENELRLDLARYMKPEMLERLSPAMLMVLKEEYTRHHQEARHADL